MYQYVLEEPIDLSSCLVEFETSSLSGPLKGPGDIAYRGSGTVPICNNHRTL